MKRITVREASEMLGIPEQAVRCGMKKDRNGYQPLPIGFLKEGKRATYYIFQEKVKEYMHES